MKMNIMKGKYTNISKFKLCHNRCGIYIKYGLTNNDQRCGVYKEPYIYDYLTNVNWLTENCFP